MDDELCHVQGIHNGAAAALLSVEVGQTRTPYRCVLSEVFWD